MPNQTKITKPKAALSDPRSNRGGSGGRSQRGRSKPIRAGHDVRESGSRGRRLRTGSKTTGTQQPDTLAQSVCPASLADGATTDLMPVAAEPFVLSEALCHVPQRPFSLPRFSHDVPFSIVRGGHNDVLFASIAEALLDAKVLCSTDWQGSLSDTIHSGLTRWVNADMHADSLRHYHFSLLWCDDIAHSGAFHDAEIYSRDGDLEPKLGARPVGAFALKYDGGFNIPTVLVGRKVLELETVLPGAGFHVLELVDDVTRFITETITPRWAYHQLQESTEIDYDGEDLEEEEIEDRGLLTVAEFERRIPAGARGGIKKFDPRVLERALQTGRYTAAQGEILVEAQHLARLWRHCEKNFNGKRDISSEPYIGIYCDSVIPLCVMWEDGDCVGRVADDYFEMAYQAEFTEICWVCPFWSDSAIDVSTAVMRLKSMLEWIRQTDRVLSLLHTNSYEDVTAVAGPTRLRV